jgi:hypothetical protein
MSTNIIEMKTIPTNSVAVTASDSAYITDSVRQVSIEAPIVFTSVNLSTEVLTKAAHGITNGAAVQVVDPGTTNLSGTTMYYAIDVATDTLKLSTVVGGSAVNIGGAATTAPTLRVSERVVTARVEGCISVVGAGDVVVLPTGHLDTDTATLAVGGAVKYTLAAGQFLPVEVKKVFATGTTATGIVCNY